MTDLNKLQEKLKAQRFRNEIQGTLNMANNKKKPKRFQWWNGKQNLEIPKKFGFKTNLRKGHEFWNVEADAFKHAFGGAMMYFRYGNLGSIAGGIFHESQTKNNPEGEWNMDSWNNDQGRKIAQEIIKEYGKDFYDKNTEKCENIIAAKIVSKMRNGELITQPSDKRKFHGILETLDRVKNNIRDSINSKDKQINQAAPSINSVKSTTGTQPNVKTEKSETNSQKFSEILRQKYKSIKSINNKKLSKIFKHTIQKTGNAHWVTINGNHVLINS